MNTMQISGSSFKVTYISLHACHFLCSTGFSILQFFQQLKIMKMEIQLKVLAYFSKFSFLFYLKNHHFKDVISNFSWNGQAVPMYEAILCIAVSYILLCKLNHGYHNQTCFHHYLPNRMLFSHEIWHGQWEKYDLPCDTKISKCLKKSWKDRTRFL